jgi:hypothetical protein
VLNEEISKEEVDKYLPIVKEYIPSATKPRIQEWEGFLKMWKSNRDSWED